MKRKMLYVVSNETGELIGFYRKTDYKERWEASIYVDAEEIVLDIIPTSRLLKLIRSIKKNPAFSLSYTLE